ncbi:hypothetical protein [Agrococcus sp. KRD186]|uniref:hypothetical protein n=1 Tax=Agrococcus sp. KRD186 TaxID=2729730 RepID=UPI0019CFDD16|nr:hypothetical protein [Agrococcus sp. KRD186]
MDAEWRKAGGILMTDAPIRAYGGLRIPREALEEFARRVTAGEVSLHAHHDNRVRMRNLRVDVVDREDGVSMLRFVTDRHKGDDQWLWAIHPLSASLKMPLARDAQRVHRDDAALSLSADHAWFEDAVLIEAEQCLLASGVESDGLQVQRALQFASEPEPWILVDIALPSLTSLGAGALWAAIEVLLAGRTTPAHGDAGAASVVNVRITDGDRAVTAVVVTADEAVAQRAIGSLDQAVATVLERAASSSASESVTIWDERSSTWLPSDAPFTSAGATPRGEAQSTSVTTTTGDSTPL